MSNGNTTGALLFIVAGIVVGYLVFTKRIFQSSNSQPTVTTPQMTPGGNPLGTSSYGPPQPGPSIPVGTSGAPGTPFNLLPPPNLLYPR